MVVTSFSVKADEVDNYQYDSGIKYHFSGKEVAKLQKKRAALQSGRLVNNLIYSSYFGGSNADIVRDMVVDDEGFIYIVGYTLSPDFYIKNAYDSDFNDSDHEYNDIFVTKFDSSGKYVIFSTYIGSKFNDLGECITLDKNNNIVIGGTSRAYNNFPVTDDALFPEIIGNYDVVIVKISADGRKLLYSTLFGGNHDDYIQDMQYDQSGNLIIAGYTKSTENFPVTENAFQKINNGKYEGWMAKLSPSLTHLQYCSYLGGSKHDFVECFTFDENDEPVFSGITFSGNFPQRTPSNYNNLQEDKCDIFITKFNQDFSNIDYSLLIGGSNDDEVFSIDTDRFGNFHLLGNTKSGDFPITADAYQKIFNKGEYSIGVSDIAYMIYNPHTENLDYSTFIGGSAYDYGINLSIDKHTNGTNIIGYSTSNDYPITLKNKQDTLFEIGNTSDAIISRFIHNGRHLSYSTYLGGSKSDIAHRVKFDSSGVLTIIGKTESDDFPISQNALDKILDKETETEVFLTKFKPDLTEIYFLTDTVTICLKETAVLSAFTIPTMDSTYFVEWYPDYKLNRTDSLLVFANPDTSMYYKVKFSNAVGVLDSTKIFVKVKHTPSNIVFGNRFTYPDTLENYWVKIESETDYNWEVEGGEVLTPLNTESVKVRWTSQKMNTVKMNAANTLHCSDSSEFTVYSHPNPFAFNLNQAGNMTVCKHDWVILDAGEGYEKYFWSSGATTRLDTVFRTGRYWCHVVDADTVWGYSDTLNLTVDTLPQIPIYGKLFVAQDDIVEYQVFMDTNFTYQWEVVNGEILEGQGTDMVKIHWSPDSLDGLIRIIATNDLGCTDTTNYNIFIGKTYAPTIVSLTGQTAICPDGYAILDATRGYMEYRWSTGDTMQTITTNEPNYYWCEVLDVNGNVHFSDTLSLSIMAAPPTPKIEYNKIDKVLICKDLAYKYEWWLIQEPKDSLMGTEKEFFYDKGGDYYLIVYNENGCSKSSRDTVFVGIEYVFDSRELNVIPNPNSGIFEISITNIPLYNAELMIYDSEGRLVKVFENNILIANEIISVDLSNFASGSYFVILKTENRLYSKKILIYR